MIDPVRRDVIGFLIPNCLLSHPSHFQCYGRKRQTWYDWSHIHGFTNTRKHCFSLNININDISIWLVFWIHWKWYNTSNVINRLTQLTLQLWWNLFEVETISRHQRQFADWKISNRGSNGSPEYTSYIYHYLYTVDSMYWISVRVPHQTKQNAGKRIEYSLKCVITTSLQRANHEVTLYRKEIIQTIRDHSPVISNGQWWSVCKLELWAHVASVEQFLFDY